jgi:hypothetical protein
MRNKFNTSEGYQGCVQYFKVNGQVLNISLPSNDVKNGLGIEECPQKKCLRRLCLNGGRCRMTNDQSKQNRLKAECICPKGTHGKLCEAKQNACLESSPCGASNDCIPTSNGSFQCVCSDTTSGKLCENNVTLKAPFSAGFVGHSFIERRGLDRNLNSIDIIFYSQKPDAVLLYNGDQNNRDQFIGIKIRKSYVAFVISINGVFEELV